jgi:2'-5' RNA ligase
VIGWRRVPRLFVAIDLPEHATAALAALRPPPGPGVRLVEPDRMHLTLHFLGEAALEPVAAALRNVSAPSFDLRLEGVGRFPSADGGHILWAGVRDSAPLTELHRAVAEALSPTGHRPETRLYHPHLTLARCRPQAPPALVRDFLSRHAAFSLAPLPIRRFALYSSTLGRDGPVHRLEAEVGTTP